MRGLASFIRSLIAKWEVVVPSIDLTHRAATCQIADMLKTRYPSLESTLGLFSPLESNSAGIGSTI
jgi:hypothetical protein